MIELVPPVKEKGRYYGREQQSRGRPHALSGAVAVGGDFRGGCHGDGRVAEGVVLVVIWPTHGHCWSRFGATYELKNKMCKIGQRQGLCVLKLSFTYFSCNDLR